MSITITYVYVVVGLICLIIFLASFFTVKQQTSAIIERFGKFNSIRQAGLQLKIPFIDRVVSRISLRIQQLDVIVETKTKDNVFVRLKVSVQYQVLKESVHDAYYKLEYPQEQITAYIFDVVRAQVPKMRLDDVFEKKDDIAIAVRDELQDAMQGYGFNIVKALVTDIEPDEAVKHAMNRINAAERAKLAAEYEAEADRIKIVAIAKAEAESKQLQGKGIADQRREIAKGLEESVKVLNGVDISSQEASALIVVTQHYDTLNSVGAQSKSNLILMPNSPGSATEMLTNMIAALSSAEAMKDKN